MTWKHLVGAMLFGVGVGLLLWSNSAIRAAGAIAIAISVLMTRSKQES